MEPIATDSIRTHLLTEADTGSGIERKENEGIWGEVLPQTVVEEAIGVEFSSCEVVRLRS